MLIKNKGFADELFTSDVKIVYHIVEKNTTRNTTVNLRSLSTMGVSGVHEPLDARVVQEDYGLREKCKHQSILIHTIMDIAGVCSLITLVRKSDVYDHMVVD